MNRFIQSVCSLFVALSYVGKVHAAAGWEYRGPLGPETWHERYPHCGRSMQSPIDIETNRVVFDRNLQSLDLREYANFEKTTLTLKNVAGHTVEVVFGGTPITIRGGSLPGVYELDQFHFHWGKTNDKGSEHLIDNSAFPMEMHLVHHMAKYDSNTSAAQPYGLAVLGFFFQIGAHNPEFEPLLSNFRDVVDRDTSKKIASFAVWDLVGKAAGGHYYRYLGSLTTPPCYESIIWTIFKDKITISQRQLDTFRTLRTHWQGEKEGEKSPISNDFRNPQPLNGRSVLTNDPAALRDAASALATDIELDLDRLYLRCASHAGASSGASGGVHKGRSSAVVGFVWGVLLLMVVLGRLV